MPGRHEWRRAIVRRDYREDIDWLRAIAVLRGGRVPHLEAPANFGGFVGVDIFFVISGYLITGIIQSEVKDGTFSFARFYERRVRRLLPALYAMVALTAIPSFHYLLASERAEFFRSVAAVVTFTLKFLLLVPDRLFRSRRGGEAAAAHLVARGRGAVLSGAAACCIWGLLRHRARQPCRAAGWRSAALALASFALCVWLMRAGPLPPNAFFMSPPRAWEFLIGGLRRDRRLSGAAATRWLQLAARGIALVAARDPDLLAAPGAGLSRLQCAFALHRRGHVSSGAASACRREMRGRFSHHQRRQILRADFLFAVSLALAAVHLRAVFEKQPGAGCLRQDRAVRADGGDLVSVMAVCRTAVPRANRWRRRAAPRFGSRGLATVVLLAGSAAGLAAQPGRAGCRPRRVCRLDVLQQLQVRAALSLRHLLRAPTSGAFGEACLALAPGKTNRAAVGRQLGRALFPWPQQGNRSASRQHPAGDAGRMHADLQAAAQGQCILPQLCRADGGILSRPQARPRHHVRRTGWNMPARRASTA